MTNRADFQSTEPSQLCQSLTSLSLLTHASIAPLKPQVALLNAYSKTSRWCEFLNSTEGTKCTYHFLPTRLCSGATANLQPNSMLMRKKLSENTLLGAVCRFRAGTTPSTTGQRLKFLDVMASNKNNNSFRDFKCFLLWTSYPPRESGRAFSSWSH